MFGIRRIPQTPSLRRCGPRLPPGGNPARPGSGGDLWRGGEGFGNRDGGSGTPGRTARHRLTAPATRAIPVRWARTRASASISATRTRWRKRASWSTAGSGARGTVATCSTPGGGGRAPRTWKSPGATPCGERSPFRSWAAEGSPGGSSSSSPRCSLSRATRGRRSARRFYRNGPERGPISPRAPRARNPCGGPGSCATLQEPNVGLRSSSPS